MHASIPSPPTSGVPIGPLTIHFYGIMIALGVAACVWLTQRRYRAIGGREGVASMLALWGVPGGLVGARAYSLATSWGIDTHGDWLRAFAIWEGGLGIWGGIAVGVVTGCIGARRHHLRLRPLFDCVAPGLALAQAVGRWGNWFNQELYGRPTTLPWAVRIDHPAAGLPGHTFQPTFLYESLWDLCVVGLLLLAERRLRVRRGWLLSLYVALYTFGRFWTEWLRIDPAHKLGPLRLNDWVSVGVFALAAGLFAWRGRARPGDERAGEPLVPGEPGTRESAAGSAQPTGAGRTPV